MGATLAEAEWDSTSTKVDLLLTPKKGKSPIEWTDDTWNTLAGCTKKSTGCKHCYAETLHNRRHQAWLNGWTDAPRQYHVSFSEVQVLPGRMSIPLRRRSPTRYFVNSMSDTFHDDVPTDHIFELLDTIGQCQIRGFGHTFYVLTKRPDRAAIVLRSYYESRYIAPYACLQLGTSVENQRAADLRLPFLAAAPARVKFLSCEPLLGPVDVSDFLVCPDCKGEGKIFRAELMGRPRPSSSRNSYVCSREQCQRCQGSAFAPQIHWIIAGGESGDQARPMHPLWAERLRDQARDAKIAFFFKQWGEWAPANVALKSKKPLTLLNKDGLGQQVHEGTDISAAIQQGYMLLERAGRRKTGRLLDGIEYSELAQ